jgi:hypothetical protein
VGGGGKGEGERGGGKKPPLSTVRKRHSSGRAGAKSMRVSVRETEKLPEIISWKKKIRVTYTLYSKSNYFIFTIRFLGERNRYVQYQYNVHNFKCLVYRPAWLHAVWAGRQVRQPFARVDYIPQSGTMNLASGFESDGACLRAYV